MASPAVTTLYFLKLSKLRNCFEDALGSFECILNSLVYRMPKNCHSQPKGGLSPHSLISCNGKGVLCANGTESILLSVLRPVLCVYRRGIRSFLAAQQRETSQASADGWMWQQQAHWKEMHLPRHEQGPDEMCWVKLQYFILWSQSAGIMCYFSQESFNFFKDSSLADPKYWWPKDKTPVLLHPFPGRKFPATFVFVVFALRPFSFY